MHIHPIYFSYTIQVIKQSTPPPKSIKGPVPPEAPMTLACQT